MPTLYVENVPAALYEALRRRAGGNRNSISAEVIALLEREVPTSAELKRRQKIFERVSKLQAKPSPSGGPFPSVVELVREDRNR